MGMGLENNSNWNGGKIVVGIEMGKNSNEKGE